MLPTGNDYFYFNSIDIIFCAATTVFCNDEAIDIFPIVAISKNFDELN